MVDCILEEKPRTRTTGTPCRVSGAKATLLPLRATAETEEAATPVTHRSAAEPASPMAPEMATTPVEGSTLTLPAPPTSDGAAAGANASSRRTSAVVGGTLTFAARPIGRSARVQAADEVT